MFRTSIVNKVHFFLAINVYIWSGKLILNRGRIKLLKKSSSSYSVIVRLKVVLKRTVVGD